MSKQKNETFSLDTVTKEEKDFLVYMYGDDLEKIVTKKTKELTWWMKAFQAVQAGKRPKFNWPALFLGFLWALRKKNIKFVMEASCGFLIAETAILYFNPAIALNIGIIFNMVLARLGPKYLIDQYLKDQQQGIAQVNGRTPFVHVILPFALSTASLVAGTLLIPKDVLPVWAHPLLSWGVIIAYTFALMKFWLPAKRLTKLKG